MDAFRIVFTAIALAGCAFLLYFLYKLWRDSRDSRTGPRVAIRTLLSSSHKDKIVRLYTAEQLARRSYVRKSQSN